MLRSTGSLLPALGAFISPSRSLLCSTSASALRPGHPRRRPTAAAANFTTSAPRQSTQPAPRAELGKSKVTVHLPNGASTEFHSVWLRDHCREERSYHAQTRQRLVDTASIPPDLQPESVRSTEAGLTVRWPSTSTESAYESFYPWSFLVKHAYEPAVLGPSEGRRKVLWGREIADEVPTVSHEEVMQTEAGVWEWLKRIDAYGFCFVRGVPATPEATEALVRRIAFIRETHYGAFWDFTADLAHGDLAYSDVPLRAHTDTTYFTDPCGLQLFHLLSPTSTHSGGHNLLVDGFHCANLLRERHPQSHELLSTLPIPAHASGSGSDSLPSGVHMAPLVAKPALEYDKSGRELIQVRWNGDDRGVVGGSEWEGKMGLWFEAVRNWERILRSEENELWTRMEPGTAIIFDNHRVLHGRSAFSGQRRLCGAYVSGDDYRSRLTGLRKQFGREESEKKWDERLSSIGVRRIGQGGASGGVWDGYA